VSWPRAPIGCSVMPMSNRQFTGLAPILWQGFSLPSPGNLRVYIVPPHSRACSPSRMNSYMPMFARRPSTFELRFTARSFNGWAVNRIPNSATFLAARLIVPCNLEIVFDGTLNPSPHDRTADAGNILDFAVGYDVNGVSGGVLPLCFKVDGPVARVQGCVLEFKITVTSVRSLSLGPHVPCQLPTSGWPCCAGKGARIAMEVIIQFRKNTFIAVFRNRVRRLGRSTPEFRRRGNRPNSYMSTAP
jgi:hypothetical protein